MKLTEHQQAIVDHRGSSLLVSASAGSGKTEVLARRCIALLTDPDAPCAVNQLLVVTFTRAAAAELRARLSSMLSSAAEQAKPPPQRAHLRRQRVLLDAADIGTIDAWCMRLLREFCAEAGIDPAYGVISPEDAELLRARTLDELMHWVYSTTEPLAAEARDWIGRNIRPSDFFLRDAIRRLSRFRDHVLSPESWLGRQQAAFELPDEHIRGAARDMLADDLRRECAFQLRQAPGLLERLTHDSSRRVAAGYQAALADWVARLDDPRQFQSVLFDIQACELAKLRGIPPADAELLDELRKKWLEKRIAQPWRHDRVAALIQHAPAAAAHARTLLKLEAEYQRRLEAAKRRLAGCEFADLLRGALDLLGQPQPDGQLAPTAVARRLRARYAHIMIDEYQDTSPLQVAVLRLVSREPPDKTNRFMVGDIKQSIYGFREAEPRLFLEQVRAFESGREPGCVRRLPDNFRSHSALLRGLNGLFERLFDLDLGGSAYLADERLLAQRDELPNATLDAAPRIELHVIQRPPRRDHPPEEDEGLPLEAYERESLLAARRIRALLDAGALVLDRDADRRPVLRPLRGGDVVVLLRSAAVRAGQIARTLRQAGVPSVAVGRESILESTEVVDLRNVLALVVNRQQDIPLAAYLRGPLVELTPQELREIRLAHPSGEFSHAVQAALDQRSAIPTPLLSRLRAALERLEAWRTAARHLDPATLLRRIIRESQIDLYARGLPGGAHRAAMIEALQQFADTAADSSAGLAAFTRRLDALADQEAAPAITPAVGDDAVRVMTIHAAKGLEFPVVLLMDAGADFPSQSAALECDAQAGLGLEFFDLPGRRELVTPAHPIAKRIRRAAELEEELRLLYVAATRAREKLIVIGHHDEQAWEKTQQRFARGATPSLLSRQNASSMLDWLLMAAVAGDAPAALLAIECHQPAEFNRADLTRARPSSEDSAHIHPVDQDWLAQAQQYVTAEVDQRLTRREAVVSASRLKHDRPEDSDTPGIIGHAAEPLTRPAFMGAAQDGQSLGLATHRFLQYADLAALCEPDLLRAEIERLVRERRITQAEADGLAPDDILWFGRSELGRWLATQANVLRETPFVLAAPVGIDNECVVVRGVIDCLVCGDDELTLLDYKTDRIRRAEARAERVEAYRKQVQVYAQAAKQLFSRRVCRATLVFLSERCLVDVPAGETFEL